MQRAEGVRHGVVHRAPVRRGREAVQPGFREHVPVDEGHQVERRAHHGRILAERQHRRNRNRDVPARPAPSKRAERRLHRVLALHRVRRS